MKISEAILKMTESKENTLHDIEHLLEVHSLAKCIGSLEGLDEKTMNILELSAIVHDISCPYLRSEHGNAPGDLQEKESRKYLEKFFEGEDIEKDVLSRIIYLVEHHHSYNDIKGMDYQILVEADFLVVAGEKKLSEEIIRRTDEKIFKTASGHKFLNNLYLKQED